MAAKKDGLDSAVEFTKFIITMDSGLIAFVTGTTFLSEVDPGLGRYAVLLALAALATSLVAGILVYMRSATMLSEGKYALNDRHLMIPGQVNVWGFAVGAVAVAALAVIELVLAPPAEEKPKAAPSCIFSVCLDR